MASCCSCGRDQREYFFCCDKGPPSTRKRDDEAFEKALEVLLEKKWAKLSEVDGEIFIELTERGYLAVQAEEAAHAAWN